MTSKLKCPFCQQELHKDPDGYFSCYTDNCSVMSAGGNGASGTESLWQALIQAKQDLEQSEKCCSAWEIQALDYKAEMIALSGKLEIVTKALKDIKKVCDNCRWCESNIYTPDCHDGRIIAETTNKALEIIGKHKE